MSEIAHETKDEKDFQIYLAIMAQIVAEEVNYIREDSLG